MACGDCKDSKWSIYLSDRIDINILRNIMINEIQYTKFQTSLLIDNVINKTSPIYTGTHNEVLKLSDIFTQKNINIDIKKESYFK